MKRTCNACGRESESCNSCLTDSMQTITVCPGCLVWGDDNISQEARLLHQQGRKIEIEGGPKDQNKKKMQRRRKV